MFIDPVPQDTATGVLAEYYQQQRVAWGFLPNYAGAFSTRPEVAQAWNALNTAIRNGMDRRRFELATIAAARALRSTYCTAAHSKFMRDVCGDEKILELIAQDPTGATLGREDRVAYQFAAKVATSAESICQQDVDQLHEIGLSDVDVADLVFAASARSFFTRVLDGLGAQLDPETAHSFSPALLKSMVVGRPPADA
ncbi:MAG: carboxymuconolactone decarboxylase family protein [Pseudonocardiales bacterium]